ncbi:MAG: BlaI/MecI/CopY family transcriptional regulator [Gemmataceae bacterium]
MARPRTDISDTQLSVLQALWDCGPQTIRQITDRLYPAGNASHYATVQKLLERLEEKSFVRRNRSGSAHTFAATLEREVLIGRRLQAMAETLCGGSLTPLLTHLVRAKRLTDRERQNLRLLIDQLDEAKGSKGKES